MKKGKKGQFSLKNLAYLLATPIIVWALMEILNRSTAGVSVIANNADVRTLFRSLASTFCFACALNCNVPMGRMDLSTGSQMYLGCILGGNIALDLGWGGIGILISSMVVGALAGLLVGVIFVNFRILPMVLGLGMTLIYECISFAIYKQQGLMLFGKQGVEILSNVWFIVLVAAIITVCLTYMMQLSSFGYKRRAIRGNQKLATDSGINIYINCVICYVVAGALVACSGVFDTAFKGAITPVLGMSSNTNTFYNMFPMRVGMFIGAFIGNSILGVFASSLSLNILIIGMSKMGVENSIQTIVIFGLFLLFMIYNMNRHKIDYNRKKRLRKKEALARREELAKLRAAAVAE